MNLGKHLKQTDLNELRLKEKSKINSELADAFEAIIAQQEEITALKAEIQALKGEKNK